MSDIEFLLDENVLGLDRHLASLNLKYKKIGDPGCPPKESDDPIVAKFAQEKGLVIVTQDEKLREQCELLEIPCVFNSLLDFAKRVKTYAESH